MSEKDIQRSVAAAEEQLSQRSTLKTKDPQTMGTIGDTLELKR